MTEPLGGPPPRWKVVLAFAAIYLVWGSTYLAIRYAIETLPPLVMAGGRFVAAGAVLYAWARLAGAARPTPLHWRSTLVLGGLLLFCGNGGVVWAEQRVPSGLAALLVAVVPVWTVLLLALWPGRQRQRPGAGMVVGLVTGLAGMALLVAPTELAGGGRIDPVGAVVLMGASLSWALASVYSKQAALPASPFLTAGMEMLTGGGLLLAAGTLSGEWRALDLAAVSPRSGLALLYLVVFGSLVGFTSFIWLLKVTSPARVSTYAYVNPVVAVFLGWAFAGEPVSVRTLLAAAVIVGAVVLVTTAGPRSSPEPQPALRPVGRVAGERAA